jgi:RNase adaptor protein for sRNA GlmZ degradation
VSGLSGSGKSIALKVLEDAGYYCVDNLPATLLLETIDWLAESRHERAAVSIDARSGALPALPEHRINMYVTTGPRAELARRLAGLVRQAYGVAESLAAE